MDKNSAERYFNLNFPSHDVNSGIIREIKEEIKKIERIVDTKERNSEINHLLNNKHKSKLSELTYCYNLLRTEGMCSNRTITIDEYSKQIDKLERIGKEVLAETNIDTQNQAKSKSRSKKSKTRNKKNYFTCTECLEENYTGKYKYNKNKKDNQKFCSDNCYYTHYAEKCDNCYEKCISSYQGKATGFAQTYYSDGINMTGTLCSKCNQEQLKEEREERKKDQEWEERSKRISKNIDELVDAMVEVAKGKEEEDLDSNDINDKEINNIERERERERAERNNSQLFSYLKGKREQLQSQQSQLLSQIMQLESNPTQNQAELAAKKQQLKDLEDKQKELTKSLPLTTQISNLEKGINQLTNKPTRTATEEALLTSKKKELRELLRKQNSSNTAKPSDRTALAIGCGAVGVVLVVSIFILAKICKKKKY